MTTTQLRVSRGIPTGGQFAPELHAEPSFNLATPAESPAENLSRSLVDVPVLTEDQKVRLRRRRTPLRDIMAKRGVTALPSMKETDDRIRSIQDRLNGRA